MSQKQKDAARNREQQARLKDFIRAVAEFVATDMARKSIELQMHKPDAVAWAKLKNSGPFFGYPTVDECEQQLTRWLQSFAKDQTP